MATTTPTTDPNAEPITVQVWVGEHLSDFTVEPEMDKSVGGSNPERVA